MYLDEKISIVIPSLGTEVLKLTLDNLRAFDSIVGEIIVVYPASRNLEVNASEFGSITRFVEFHGMGQVAQRAFGFNLASFSITLQMDDDCIITDEDLEKLVSRLRECGRGFTVAPALVDALTGQYFGEMHSRSTFSDVIASLIVGSKFADRKMGTISKAGTLYPVNPLKVSPDSIEVEWLPGGCMLHWTEDLIRHNYYPFPGRAGLEDAIHCYLLEEKGIKKILYTDIVVKTDATNTSAMHDLHDSSRAAMKYLNVLRGKSMWRTELWYYLSILRIKIQKIAIFKRRT